MYIHELKDWPRFHWSTEKLAEPLASVRHRQGRLIGHMEALGFNLQAGGRAANADRGCSQEQRNRRGKARC